MNLCVRVCVCCVFVFQHVLMCVYQHAFSPMFVFVGACWPVCVFQFVYIDVYVSV